MYVIIPYNKNTAFTGNHEAILKQLELNDEWALEYYLRFRTCYMPEAVIDHHQLHDCLYNDLEDMLNDPAEQSDVNWQESLDYRVSAYTEELLPVIQRAGNLIEPFLGHVVHQSQDDHLSFDFTGIRYIGGNGLAIQLEVNRV